MADHILRPGDLLKVWSSPSDTRLSAKQTSIRLPVLVAAKIMALQSLYPKKTKTEIISDLLATALTALEVEQFSSEPILDPQGEIVDFREDHQGMMYDSLVKKYEQELLQESEQESK